MPRSDSSAHSTRTAPPRTSVSTCACVPHDVAFSTTQHASVRTPLSVAASVHRAMTCGRQPLSMTAWICGGVPAATLDSVHAASFWISRELLSASSHRSTGTTPSSTAPCV